MRYQPHGSAKRARRLRQDATPAERQLWRGLRNLAFKFRRQHRINRFILDFYCAEVRLAVELDGNIHYREDVRLRDEARDAELRALGIRVIHFRNEDVLWKVWEVVERIEDICAFL